MIAEVDAAQLAIVAEFALSSPHWPAAARAELAELVTAVAERSDGFWSGYAESCARHLRDEVRPS